MAEFLAMAARTGEFTENFNCPPHNNRLTVVATFTNPTPGVGLSFLIEQRNQGQWSVMGGSDVADVAATMATPNKDGSPRTNLRWTFTEQIVSDPGEGETTGTVNRGGKVFSQYAMSPVQRITFNSYAGQPNVPAELTYAFDIVADAMELTEFSLPVTNEPGNGGGNGGGQGGNGNGNGGNGSP